MIAPTIDSPTRTLRKADRLAEGLTFRTTEYDGDVRVEAVIYFDENCEAERDAWVAQFPKSNRLHTNTAHGRDENYYASRPFPRTYVAVDKVTGAEVSGVGAAEARARSAWILPMAEFQVLFTSTGVTGAKNEAGYKRLSSFLRNLNKIGITWQHKQQKISNAQPGIDDVLARFA